MHERNNKHLFDVLSSDAERWNGKTTMKQQIKTNKSQNKKKKTPINHQNNRFLNMWILIVSPQQNANASIYFTRAHAVVEQKNSCGNGRTYNDRDKFRKQIFARAPLWILIKISHFCGEFHSFARQRATGDERDDFYYTLIFACWGNRQQKLHRINKSVVA